jgi:hypothetical protein
MNNAAQLAAILSKSKAVMDTAEKKFGKTGGSTSGGGMSTGEVSYSEKEMPNLTEEFIAKQSGTPRSVAPKNGQYRNLETTKLPKEIVDAMINNPIEIPESPFAVDSFNVNEVSQLMKEGTVEVPEQIQETKQTTTKSTIPVTDDIIRRIVREEMEDVVRSVIAEYFDASLVTEDIQIKVGDTVFSGNLKPLPKKKVVRKKRRQ